MCRADTTGCGIGPHGWESIPGLLLQGLQIRALSAEKECLDCWTSNFFNPQQRYEYSMYLLWACCTHRSSRSSLWPERNMAAVWWVSIGCMHRRVFIKKTWLSVFSFAQSRISFLFPWFSCLRAESDLVDFCVMYGEEGGWTLFVCLQKLYLTEMFEYLLCYIQLW